MDQRTHTVVQEFGRRLATKYDVRGLVLFGSRARNDYSTESDADVLVLLPDEIGSPFRLAIEISDVAYYVGLDMGMVVSPLPVTVAQWAHPDRFSNPFLLRTIAREGVPVAVPSGAVRP